jgi:hypothetical protein
MIRHAMPLILDRAEPPTRPSGPLSLIAKIIITLGILSQVTGLLCLNQARHQKLST